MLGTLYAQGFWDESRAVHIKARSIETSTLVIGTHLIHLSALTDSVYEIAEKSAEESGQNQIYYKSELGGDAWFNISSATSLSDITTSGMPITDEEIEELYFTHHTKSDKITYDLRTGQAVNIFDIRDPYALESLEELSPLKMQYDQVREMQGENKVTKRIDEIWDTPVNGSEGPAAIQKLEKELSALQTYLSVLSENGADSREIDKVTFVMEAVDAARRYEVFTVLEPVLSEYLDELGKGEMISITTGEGDEKTTVELMENAPELMSAVAESLGNVQDALITYGGKMLSEGTTVISQIEYEYSNALVSHAAGGAYTSCDTDVQTLLLLDNIQNDVISDRPKELGLLENTLLPKANSAYQEALSQGESAEYRAEVAKQSAQAILNRLISENEGEVNARRGELEFLIEAKCKRIDVTSGMAFIEQWLDMASNNYASAIPQDAFAETSQASLESHIEYLVQKHRELELANGGNAMDELIAKKEALQDQRLSSLDKNDLVGAKALEEQIADVEEEIRAIEAEVTAQITQARDKIQDLEVQVEADQENMELKNQLSAAKAELSNLESSLSDGSLGAMVAQLKRDALDGLDDGTSEGIDAAANAVDALSGVLPTDPKLVLPAMQEIYNKLLLSGGDQNLIDSVEQAILENPNALREELTAAQLKEITKEYLKENGSDSGTEVDVGAGTGTGGTHLLGAGGITQAAASDAAIELTALQLYYDETGSRAASQQLASVAQEQKNLGNPLVFQRIQDGSGEYVPLSAIQVLTGRRYVWNKNESLGVLAQGADYYGFTVYSSVVRRDRDGEKTEKMSRVARYQAGVHIPEEYAYDRFGVQTLYLAGTSLGCACDDTVLAKAQELFAQFLAA